MIVLLIAINALFVAGEFAVVSVPQSKVRDLAEQKHWAARFLWPILKDTHDFDRYIAACQVGITISSLILGAYGQTQMMGWLQPFMNAYPALDYLVIPTILVFLTVFQMLLGELVPKSISLQYPVQAALWTTYPMLAALWVLRLPIAILNGSGNGLLKLMGFQPEAHRHIHSSEEIMILLSEGEEMGVLGKTERQRMHQALQISQWFVRDLMVHRAYLQTINLKDSVRKNLNLIAKARTSTLLVYDGKPDQIKGFIRTQEILRYVLINGGIKQLDSFIHEILVIPRNLEVQRALIKFREHRTRLALVVDDYGGVAGLLTLRDILAELTGAVGDEFALARTAYQHLSDGRYRLSGQMRLDQLKEKLDIDWDSEFTNTVGGFIQAQLDRLPYRGEVLRIGQHQIEIEKVSARAVVSVFIKEKPL